MPAARMRSSSGSTARSTSAARSQAEDDAADVGLVEQARRDRLRDQRIAEPLGGRDRSVDRRRLSVGDQSIPTARSTVARSRGSSQTGSFAPAARDRPRRARRSRRRRRARSACAARPLAPARVALGRRQRQRRVLGKAVRRDRAARARAEHARARPWRTGTRSSTGLCGRDTCRRRARSRPRPPRARVAGRECRSTTTASTLGSLPTISIVRA